MTKFQLEKNFLTALQEALDGRALRFVSSKDYIKSWDGINPKPCDKMAALGITSHVAKCYDTNSEVVYCLTI